MNSKGHLFISLGKSAIRIIGAIVALIKKSVVPLAIGVIVAEIGGVLEELVDERWWITEELTIAKSNKKRLYRS